MGLVASPLSADHLMVQRPRNVHSSYHVSASPWVACPVGPHPYWSCQLSFDSAAFDAVIPWLDAHRGRLNVLVHGVTGNHLADHTTHAAWLGEPAVLDLSVFER
jgi:DOPA 4,5-dioxygenase